MSSAEVRRVPPCTMSVLSPSVMVPSGSSTPLASIASRIDWLLNPPSASASVSGVISMRFAVVPSSVASRTSSICCRSLRVDASRRADRSSWSRSLVTATTRTGRSASDPGDHPRVDRFRQRADAVDRELHLLLDRREVGAVGERRGDAGQPRGRGRRGRLEPRHPADRRLDRSRDVCLDDVGARARVLGDDDELRQSDRREELLLERRQRDTRRRCRRRSSAGR